MNVQPSGRPLGERALFTCWLHKVRGSGWYGHGAAPESAVANARAQARGHLREVRLWILTDADSGAEIVRGYGRAPTARAVAKALERRSPR